MVISGGRFTVALELAAYPPLPCRASPPHVGRSASGTTFTASAAFKMGES
ncbi:hypothetical protein GGQ73_000889 [Rhizobium skierniewicense]|uniref:Uncharacterized protein n=1 Tax=Rhizobium skierniewicense TaxID=984260 RepID=A0A7W6C5T7_9HYPH|nr:hypothetical protein [Rhizobium skierniewicense]